MRGEHHEAVEPQVGRLVHDRLARQEGAADGFRTIVNTGRVGRQDVYHLHIHIIGGPDPLPRMLAVAGRLAREQGSPDGFRTVVNTGRIGRQDVYHLHIHILGGGEPLPRMIASEKD